MAYRGSRGRFRRGRRPANPHAFERPPRFRFKGQIPSVEVATERFRDRERVLQAEVPLLEPPARDRDTADAAQIGQALVTQAEALHHGRQFAHGRSCTDQRNVRPARIVARANLMPLRGSAYVPAVPNDTLLSELMRDWLTAAWEVHPRRSKRAVALRLGLPVPTVNRIIRGKRDGNIELDSIGLMARRTGYSAAYIVDCIEQRRPLPEIPQLRRTKPKAVPIATKTG